jgi:DNA-binding transcriptional MocR family regulator
MDRHDQSQLETNGLVDWLREPARAGRGPRYRRLADALRGAIKRGDLADGVRLPPERALARQLAVSRATVVAAYDILRDEQLLDRRQGSGTRVRNTASPRPGGMEVGRMLRRPSLVGGTGERPANVIDLLGAYLLGVGGLPAVAFEHFDADLAALSHSSGYAPLGYQPLRDAISTYLTRRGLATQPQQVLITAGAQQAIHLAAWLYVQRGDRVLVENPTYPGALDVFTGIGAHLIGVPTRRSGVAVERVAELIEREAPRAMYIIPTYQNPVGGVLSQHGRQALASLVESHQTPLLEDDSLIELGIDGEPPLPIACFARSTSPILTIGSLSKLCWPGLRIGWVRAAEPIITQLGRLKATTDLGGSLPAQVIATHIFGAIEDIRRERAPVLAERLELVSRLLSSLLPTWSWDRPRGGLCLWVRLPYGSAGEFSQVASRFGVSIVPGTVASTDGGYDDYVRLPFGHPPAVLEEGIQRLARAWRAYAPGGQERGQNVAVIV